MSTSDPDTDDDDGRVPDLPELPGGGPWERRFAYLWLTALVVVPVAGFVALVTFGFVSVDVTLQANADVAWVVEYTVAALAAIFVVFTFLQVARVAGVGFLNGLAEAVVTVVDNYERPSNRNGPNE
jgi:hypothetical protein